MCAIRKGDRVEFVLPIFSGGSFFRGRCTGKPTKVGEQKYSGVVERHSYGEKTGQHTFSIRLDDGKLKLVKGRNLYPNLTKHIVDETSPDRITLTTQPEPIA